LFHHVQFFSLIPLPTSDIHVPDPGDKKKEAPAATNRHEAHRVSFALPPPA
jgi:hypothetical protein